VRRLFAIVLLACMTVVGVALRAQQPARATARAATAPAAGAAPRSTPAIAPVRSSARAAANAPAIITPASVRGFETVVKPFVAEFCYSCHGNKGEAKNGLNIQAFQSVESLIEQRNHWEDVMGMLKRSEMPRSRRSSPKKKPGRRWQPGWSASSPGSIA